VERDPGVTRRIATNVVTVAPVDEPVSIEDVKANLRIVDNDEEDGFIRTQLIPTAREVVENVAVRSLITQTRKQCYDCMPCSPIYLRYGPVQSVTSFTYTDTNGTVQTLAATEYEVDTLSTPPRIVEAYGKSWPVARDQVNSVNITYVAGFGSIGKVKPTYRKAIIWLCTHWYWNPDQFGCAEGDVLSRLESMLGIVGMSVEYA
jgi:uncharacterized phiE125 gp8 family phage protein